MRKVFPLLFLLIIPFFGFFKKDYEEVLRFKKKGIEVILYSETGSIKTGGNKIKVVVKPPKEIKEFYFYMPPMPGMSEMRDVAKLEKISEGVYEASLNISMDGPWQIRVVFSDGSMITHDVFVPIVKGKMEKPAVMVHGNHIMVSPEKLQLIGVITEPVRKLKLEKRFFTVGYIDYNLSKVHDITVRADAWVENTFGRFEGEYVKRGTPLMRILSPDMKIALEEYEHAKRIGDKELMEKARRKLEYYRARSIIRSPISGVILKKNVYDGGFVKEGFVAYRIADISEAWIVAEIPLNKAGYIYKGTEAVIVPEENPHHVIHGKVDYIFPEVNKLSRTVKVRIRAKNKNLMLKPNSLVEVRFHIPLGEVLAVPETAVIDTGRRTVVFVEMEKGMYMPVNVKLGRKGEGYYEVLHGLKEGDRVVVKGTFLLDAEAQIRGLYGEAAAPVHHHYHAPMQQPKQHTGHEHHTMPSQQKHSGEHKHMDMEEKDKGKAHEH